MSKPLELEAQLSTSSWPFLLLSSWLHAVHFRTGLSSVLRLVWRTQSDGSQHGDWRVPSGAAALLLSAFALPGIFSVRYEYVNFKNYIN